MSEATVRIVTTLRCHACGAEKEIVSEASPTPPVTWDIPTDWMGTHGCTFPRVDVRHTVDGREVRGMTVKVGAPPSTTA